MQNFASFAQNFWSASGLDDISVELQSAVQIWRECWGSECTHAVFAGRNGGGPEIRCVPARSTGTSIFVGSRPYGAVAPRERAQNNAGSFNKSHDTLGEFVFSYDLKFDSQAVMQPFGSLLETGPLNASNFDFTECGLCEDMGGMFPIGDGNNMPKLRV